MKSNPSAINKTHGLSCSRIYKIWIHMRNRCANPSDPKHKKGYRDRGITVCGEWRNDFMAFHNWAMANGYSDDLTLDRENNDKGYSPGNCRWITNDEQQRNKSNSRYISFDGRTQIIAQWARELGVTDSTIRSRIRRGENPVEVLSLFVRGA